MRRGQPRSAPTSTTESRTWEELWFTYWRGGPPRMPAAQLDPVELLQIDPESGEVTEEPPVVEAGVPGAVAGTADGLNVGHSVEEDGTFRSAMSFLALEGGAPGDGGMDGGRDAGDAQRKGSFNPAGGAGGGRRGARTPASGAQGNPEQAASWPGAAVAVGESFHPPRSPPGH